VTLGNSQQGSQESIAGAKQLAKERARIMRIWQFRKNAWQCVAPMNLRIFYLNASYAAK